MQQISWEPKKLKIKGKPFIANIIKKGDKIADLYDYDTFIMGGRKSSSLIPAGILKKTKKGIVIVKEI